MKALLGLLLMASSITSYAFEPLKNELGERTKLVDGNIEIIFQHHDMSSLVQTLPIATQFSDKMLLNRVEIMIDGETIYKEGQFYNFNLNAWLSDDRNYIILYDSFNDSPLLTIIDINGNTLFQGAVNEPYAEPKLQKLSDINPIESAIEEEEKDEKIILICGWGRPTWLDEIVSLIFDEYRNPIGINYQYNDEIRQFWFGDYNDYQQRLEKIAQQHFDGVEFCTDGNYYRHQILGNRIVRWCEDDQGVIQGDYQIWQDLYQFFDNSTQEYQANHFSLLNAGMALIETGQFFNGILVDEQIKENHGSYYTLCDHEKNTCKYFDENNELLGLSSYQQGIETKFVAFDGDYIDEICENDPNTHIGYCKGYRANGSVDYYTEYYGNLQHGEEREYNEDGELTSIAYYDMDEEISEQVFDSEQF